MAKKEKDIQNKKDNNIYVHENGRYKPIGLDIGHFDINDGIWYVRHHDHCKSITNVNYISGLFKIGDSREISVPQLAGLQDYCDYIENSDEWKEILNKGSYTLEEIVHLCVKKVFDKSKEILENKETFLDKKTLEKIKNQLNY